MATKKKNKLWVKMTFLTLIVVSAAAFAIGSFLVIMDVGTTKVEKLADISGSFGNSFGVPETNQLQETSSMGMATTTVEAIADPKKMQPTAQILRHYAKSINEVANGEVVNFAFEAQGAESKNLSLKYYAATAEDYDNGNFNKTLRFLEAAESLDMYEISVVVRPTETGRYVEVSGTTRSDYKEEADKYKESQSRFVNLVDERFDRVDGDVFDVTFNTPATAEQPTAVAIQTVYDSDLYFENAINIPVARWEEITQFAANSKYDFLNATKVSFYVPAAFNQEKLSFVIPDEGAEAFAQKVAGMTPKNYSEDAIYVPRPYDISFRYSENSRDEIIIGSYFAD